MKISKILLAFLVVAAFGCNTSRDELIIQDLKNNNIDTSTLSSNDGGSSGNGSGGSSSSDALGTQKISVSVIIAPSFSKPVTRVRVRAFTSRTPIVASTWMDLSASTTAGTYTGTYGAAPNPTTKFGLHVQAYNGSTLVGEAAGLETEYTNNGDGSTIVGNVITLTTAQ